VEEADFMFDVLLHVGSLLAVFAAYRQDVRGLWRGTLGLIGLGKDRGRTSQAALGRKRLAVFILVGTIPMLLALPFYKKVAALSGSTLFVGLMLLLTGLILYGADRFSRAPKEEREISLLDVLLVGLSQAIAVIPGISRSGITISAGLTRVFPKSYAVKFSFLLSIPAILGGAILSLVQAVNLGFDPGLLPMYGTGMLAAAVSGYFSIRLLRYVAAKNTFGGFSYYCWGAGIVAVLLSLVA
jgi:undecaprenyl-diphosphatase